MKFKLRVHIAFISIFFLSATSFVGENYAQEMGLIQSKYYSPIDYEAGTQNWAVVQDQRGVMYFGNVNGVLEFNGESWNLIPTANQSSVRSLSIDKDGIIYVGGYNELGYLLPDGRGIMHYHSLIPFIEENLLDFGEVWDINCFEDTVFILTDRYLFRFIDGHLNYWESKNEGYYLTHNVNNELYIQELGVGLMKFENDSIHLVEKGDFFNEIMIHSIFPIEDGFLICTRNNGLYTYKSINNKIAITPLQSISANGKKLNDYFVKHSFYHGAELVDGLIALGSIGGDILIVNSDWDVVDIINHETIGIKSPTFFLYFADNQYLWLALDNGISLVEVLSPFRYWNEGKGIIGNLTDVAKLRDTLFISTGSGIYYTTNRQIDNYSINSFTTVEGNFEQAWEFLYFTPPTSKENKKSRFKNSFKKDTILLVSTRKGVFKISGGKSINISGYDALQTLHQSTTESSNLFLGLADGVALLTYEDEKWTDKGYKFNLDTRVNGIGEDPLGNLWLSSDYKGLYRVTEPLNEDVDSVKIEFFDTNHGLSSVSSIRIFDNNDPLLFIIDSKYYTFNDSIKRFEIYDISNFYDSTSKSQQQLNDSLAWERVWGDILTYFYVTHPEDSIVWFSTNKGMFRCTPGTKRDYSKMPSALINRVLSGDSVIFNGANIKEIQSPKWSGSDTYLLNPTPNIELGTILKYNNNSLTFIYSVPFFEGEKLNKYSFWLVGYDGNWSEWNEENKKEYTNLPHGEYSFRVKAINIYGIESGVAEYQFTILPPWYLTIYAFLGYFLILGLIVYLIVRIYTYRLILEKDRLEIMVKERTQEILIQKEEILVQSEHLKEANDWISAKNVELEAQKNEIEKKKNQLEISDATKNKFFRIIAHDLRNPISTVVNTTGHIISNIQDFDKEKTKRFVEELNKLSLTTYNLLENLLDWSSSQMGEIKYQPKTLDLNSIIVENLELIRSKVDSKAIELKLSINENIMVNADNNMVHTIVRNLISNAVKFTNDNGVISISTEIKNGYCYLSISDNGVGISEDNLKNLFRIEKDVRTHGTRNERGSGLGLILCKEFIELNGGQIFVESELEKGSKFTITLKLA